MRKRFFNNYSGIRTWHSIQGSSQETRTVLGRRRTFNGSGHFTEKLNSPVQGTGADGLKLALTKLWETRDSIDAFPVLAIHDEIVVEAPVDKAEAAKEWLAKCMIEAMAEILTEVPVAIEAEIKESWG